MAIFNQVVAGGGTTPTGTKQITTNGTHDVAAYATADVQVPTTAPAHYIDFSVDANGKLMGSNTPLDLTGVTGLTPYVLYAKYKYNTNFTSSVDWSSLTSISGNYACYEAFNGSNVSSIDLSGVTTISGDYVMNNAFSYSRLTSLDLRNVQTIGPGTYGCNEMCKACSQLTSVRLDSLTTLQTALTNAFENCTNLVYLSIPNLSELTYSGASLNSLCAGCSKLEELDLGSLYQINGSFAAAAVLCSGCSKLIRCNLKSLAIVKTAYGFNTCFNNCSSLETMKFESLNVCDASNAFGSMFNGCSSLKSLWFYAVDDNTFGSNRLGNMFNSSVNGCAVHFPIRVQSTIGAWTSTTNGFGGTNTTVSFDLVTSLTGADGNTYTRSEKNSTSTATAWLYNDTLYYTSGVSDNANGVNEPSVSDAIYSDAACTQSVTTVSAIA